MTITITNTSKIVELNGVPARVWEGKTNSGIPVHCFITRIACEKDANQEDFQRELSEQKAPSREIEAYPLKLVI